MFRRPGKNPLEEETPKASYQEEAHRRPTYPYGPKAGEGDGPPRIFDTPHKAAPHSPLVTPMSEENWGEEKTTQVPHHFREMAEEDSPETTLGEGVTFRGELSFERLLRIDGTFEGDLLSQGKVVVGPEGKVKASLNLREAIIEGEVDGNITVQEKLELRGEAIVHGDIQAKSIVVDEGVTIVGTVHVDPKS